MSYLKILFVGYNLYTGGIQRSLINILKELSKNHDLEIFLFLFSNSGELVEEIPESIRIIKSNYFLTLTAKPFSTIVKEGNLLNIMVRIILAIMVRLLGSQLYLQMIFPILKNRVTYDIAISFFNDVPNNYFNQGCNLFLDKKVVARKKIGWFHTDPIKAKFSREFLLKTYKNFDLIVHVSKAGKENFVCLVPEYQHKSTVVYNLFPYESISDLAKSYSPEFQINIVNFVTVARIDNSSKRIDRIVEIVRMLKLSGDINFKWWIIGDGPDFKRNLELVHQYQLSELIEFTGLITNPLPYVSAADAFILTSDYEGFPMVVCESLSLNTPVITTAYSSAEEQIENGVTGIIVEVENNALFNAIQRVLIEKEILIKLKRTLKAKPKSNKVALTQLNKILGMREKYEVNGS